MKTYIYYAQYIKTKEEISLGCRTKAELKECHKQYPRRNGWRIIKRKLKWM